ncbi:MAG: hypothetical protein EOO77_39340 [Oxalobacteraceae bacterium]|nr:MAG: hypothetical protein EOO77_39340 [Oxalobacteraceae bacterium]
MADFYELPQLMSVRLSYGFALKGSTIKPSGWLAIQAARGWCLEQYGISDHWDYQHDTFLFECVEDAVNFKLRWC